MLLALPAPLALALLSGNSPGAMRRSAGDGDGADGADVAVDVDVDEEGLLGLERKNFRLPSKASRT